MMARFLGQFMSRSQAIVEAQNKFLRLGSGVYTIGKGLAAVSLALTILVD